MSGQHAILACSAAPGWGECSGWVQANADAPDNETEDTRDGDAAHWVVAECLTAWRCGADVICAGWLGRTAPNGVIIDDKHTTGAQFMVDDVVDVARRHNALGQLLIEHRVHAPQIHAENWGTLDCSLPVHRQHGLITIFLWDYKHGHRENKAFGNLQLIDYVAGLVNELNLNGIDDQGITVVLRIVQPYCYKAAGVIDEWAVKLSDLRGYFNQLRQKANEAMSGQGKMSAGLWCRDCAKVGLCATGRRFVTSRIEFANRPYEMDAMEGSELAAERDTLIEGQAVLKKRLEAIEAELYHCIKNGAVDTTLALETVPGKLKWTVPVPQAVALASQFGIDAAKADVKTPTQVIAAAPAGMRKIVDQAVKSMAKRDAGSLSLINADDTIGARAFKRK